MPPRKQIEWVQKDEQTDMPEYPEARESQNPHQRDAEKVFGKIQLGQNGRPLPRWEATALTQITLPFQMRLAWDKDVIVRRMTCHRGVARSLAKILGQIKEHYGTPEAIKEARMDLFGGCYNYRPVRGGTSLSQHAYGAAIDLDPDKNGLGTKGSMPPVVVKIFEDEGWTWGGRWTGRPDPMHFQYLRV